MTRATIFEGFAGLHFQEGKLVEVLPAGRYVYWSGHHRITVVDLRSTMVLIGGQEIVSKDGGTVRISVFLNYRVSDPKLNYLTVTGESNGSSATRIHLLAQARLREWLIARDFIIAMEQRESLCADILPLVREDLAAFGIEALTMNLLEMSATGGLKAAYADLLKVEIEGRVAMERARNESATMRNLLNTARLVEQHPTLMQLRVLTSGQKPKVTFVVGSQPSSPPAEIALTEE